MYQIYTYMYINVTIFPFSTPRHLTASLPCLDLFSGCPWLCAQGLCPLLPAPRPPQSSPRQPWGRWGTHLAWGRAASLGFSA